MTALLRRLRRIKSWRNRCRHLVDVVFRRDRGLDEFRMRWWLEPNPWGATEIWFESWRHRWDDGQDAELVDLVTGGVFEADVEWLADDGGRWDNELIKPLFGLWYALAESYGLRDACELVCGTCGGPIAYEGQPFAPGAVTYDEDSDAPSRCLSCGERRNYPEPSPTDASEELPF